MKFIHIVLFFKWKGFKKLPLFNKPTINLFGAGLKGASPNLHSQYLKYTCSNEVLRLISSLVVKIIARLSS